MINAENNRIIELEKLILTHQNAYYNGEPLISDAEFDALWDELKNLHPDSKILHKIGADSSDTVAETAGIFQKTPHIMPMGSQEKAANPAEFTAWAQKQLWNEYLVEYKLDGASLELQYENGLLTRAVTRGDGTIGDDITRNVVKMHGAVKKIVKKGNLADSDDLFFDEEIIPLNGAVRGEVIMTHEVHKKYFSDKANCRNAANGLMKRKDGNGCEHLRVVCYDAYFPTDTPYTDEEEKIHWLAAHGFETVPLQVCANAESVIEYRAKVIDIRSSLDYDIDGLVIKGKTIDLTDAARARPEKQIAFKFSLEEAVSILRSVEWSESGATYTPIGEFDAVELAGTTVQRASLNNPNMIRSLNIKIGSHVIITKRGEIIPKIEALALNPPDAQNIEQPTVCNVCQTLLVDEGTRLYCPNMNCPKRIHHRLEKWISVLDVRDFGIGLIKRLFENGRLRSISDFYTLTTEELAALDRMGEKSAAKVIKSLQSRREVSLAAFCAGFDIEGIGETLFEKLILGGFNSLETILSATVEHITNVHGFGEITARILVQGFAESAAEMRFLVQNNIISIRENAALPLAGKSFCFTGELALKRTEAEALVKKAGGSIKAAVTKDLSYLVTNDVTSGSSKNKKAADLGILIISEHDFLCLLKADRVELP